MSHFTVAVFSKTPNEVDYLLEPFQEEVEPSSPYAEFEKDDTCEEDEITGEKGYWHNPNAKWDWYSVGGRWSGYLKLKNGKKIDRALVKNCDFSVDKDEYDNAIRFWEVAIEGLPLIDGEDKEDFDCFYKPEYYIEQYGTKEKYAKFTTNFSTFAFLTDDGKWIEQGSMGWFGCSTTTNESMLDCQRQLEEYLKYAIENNLYITIVDCHI